MDTARVTVIVTCCNQEQWIEQALDSVTAQSERSVQLIITDDGSTDGSRSTIERWVLSHGATAEQVFADRNIGLPAMLNRAMPLVRGRYVVILNGDDWMEPHRLDAQAAALDAADAAVGLVYSDLRVVDRFGVPTGERHPHPDVPRPEGDVLHRIIVRPMMGAGMTMFRRDVLDRIGPWDESLVADDYDFLLRTAAAGFEFIYLPTIVLNYRWYDSNLTNSRAGALVEGRIASLRKVLGRDAETDRLVYRRMRSLVHQLHTMGHNRKATRRHLMYLLRHAATPGVLRELLENHAGLEPGALSCTRLRRHVR